MFGGFVVQDDGDNILLKHFGFQSGSVGDPQANVDWDFAVRAVAVFGRVVNRTAADVE